MPIALFIQNIAKNWNWVVQQPRKVFYCWVDNTPVSLTISWLKYVPFHLLCSVNDFGGRLITLGTAIVISLASHVPSCISACGMNFRLWHLLHHTLWYILYLSCCLLLENQQFSNIFTVPTPTAWSTSITIPYTRWNGLCIANTGTPFIPLTYVIIKLYSIRVALWWPKIYLLDYDF